MEVTLNGGRYLNSPLKGALLEEKPLGLRSFRLSLEEFALSIYLLVHFHFYRVNIKLHTLDPNIYKLFEALLSEKAYQY